MGSTTTMEEPITYREVYIVKVVSCAPSDHEEAESLITIAVVFNDPPEKKFRLGKTNFMNVFIPDRSTVVTELHDNIEFPSEEAVAHRLMDLMSHDLRYSPYVARVAFGKLHRILLTEEVTETMQSWIDDMERKLINSDRSWFVLIHKDLFKQFKDFGLGLRHIHEKGYVFDGSLSDLIKTPTGIKLLKVKKPKSTKEFDVGKDGDWEKFIEFFLDCLYKPAHGSKSWAIAHPDSPEIKQLGFSSEVLKVTQVQNIKDLLVEVAQLLRMDKPLQGWWRKKTKFQE